MKNIKISIISIAIISTVLSYGQSYSSTFEEEVFKSFKKDSLNYNFFESLFAIDSSIIHETVLKHEK